MKKISTIFFFFANKYFQSQCNFLYTNRYARVTQLLRKYIDPEMLFTFLFFNVPYAKAKASDKTVKGFRISQVIEFFRIFKILKTFATYFSNILFYKIYLFMLK